MKTIKRIMVTIIVAMMAVGFNGISAEAYTVLQTSTYITATGTLSGDTVTFALSLVEQGGVTPKAQIEFTSPSGISDSGEAIKITGGGSSFLDTRFIVYTDNDSYFSTGNDPRVEADGTTLTGLDGSGMPGASSPGYVATLFWGINSAADYAPNVNVDYGFDGNMNDGIGEVYIVDIGHTVTLCTVDSDLDNNLLYEDTAGTIPSTPVNVASDGLYPQSWDKDYYDPSIADNPSTPYWDERMVSPALYKSIATIAYNVGYGADPDETYYTCEVGNISTVATDDTVIAKLSKIDESSADSLYIYVGADFVGKPAQTYTTEKLYVALVRD